MVKEYRFVEVVCQGYLDYQKIDIDRKLSRLNFHLNETFHGTKGRSLLYTIFHYPLYRFQNIFRDKIRFVFDCRRIRTNLLQQFPAISRLY